MSNEIVIKAEKRDVTSKGALRSLRKSGVVPGIVYGKSGAVAIAIHAKLLPKGHTRTKLVTLDVDGAARSVLMREVQVDPLTDAPLHFDFQEIENSSVVTIKVPLEFVGLTREQEKEGSFKVLLRSLECKVAVNALPSSLQVKVGHLKVDQSAHVSDIEIPANVKVIAKKNLALASLVK